MTSYFSHVIFLNMAYKIAIQKIGCFYVIHIPYLLTFFHSCEDKHRKVFNWFGEPVHFGVKYVFHI